MDTYTNISDALRTGHLLENILCEQWLIDAQPATFSMLYINWEYHNPKINRIDDKLRYRNKKYKGLCHYEN